MSVFFYYAYGNVCFGVLFPYEIRGRILSGEIPANGNRGKSSAAEGEPQVIPTALEEEQVISADTQYIIEEVDLQKALRWKRNGKRRINISA